MEFKGLWACERNHNPHRKEVKTMSTKSTVERLRETVLGSRGGREVEVNPTGEIIFDSDQREENQNIQISKPKKAKMDKHVFGL
jgi:hypothetical protein